MVSGLLQQHVDFRKTKQVNMISGTTQQLLDFQKTKQVNMVPPENDDC